MKKTLLGSVIAASVAVAGLTAGTIEASRGVKLVPDTTWDQISPADYDIILLPGGFRYPSSPLKPLG